MEPEHLQVTCVLGLLLPVLVNLHMPRLGYLSLCPATVATAIAITAAMAMAMAVAVAVAMAVAVAVAMEQHAS